jgi:hypothetical protein
VVFGILEKSRNTKLMKILRFVTLLSVVCLSTAAFAQKSKIAEIKRIDAYCKTVDAIPGKRKGAQLVFADVSDMNDKKEKWRKFASEKALEKFRETTETYTIAYNWLKNGKIVVSNFTLFSGSGDWAKYVYHYFRMDGSLARVESELRTFYGHYIAVRRLYFDRKGKMVHQSVKYLDLETKKPKKPSSDFLGDNSSWKEVDYFKKTSKLPFAHLLKKPAK